MNLFIFLLGYLSSHFRKRWKPKKIAQHQKKRRESILKYAKHNSPFYRDLFQGESNFFSLPIISKTEMMQHFSSLNTKKIKKETAFSIAQEGERTRKFDSNCNGIAIGLSSGTSGNKGIFLTSKKERALWAGNILEKILPTPLYQKTSIGLFLRSNNHLYETLQSKKIVFSYFDLQDPFELLFQRLEKDKPKILVAPPSILRMFVDRKLKYVPDKIIACAEKLDPLDKRVIEKYFNKRVHQVYQCTEGFLAMTCEYGTLHINEDLVFLEKEYIDKKTGRFIPIITDLYRTTQPIIRYRLDDILVERKSTCPCGSHFLALERIEGRCDDILYFKNKAGARVPLFPDFIRREIIFFSDRIKDYQVIQTTLDEISIYTDPYLPLSSHLHKYFIQCGLVPPKIHQLKAPMKRELWDKKRRIIRGYNV